MNIPLFLQTVSLSRDQWLALCLALLLFFLLVLYTVQFMHKKRLQRKLAHLERENFQLNTTLSQERNYFEQQLTFIREGRQEMNEQFQFLAQSVLEQKSNQVTKIQEDSLGALLSPFQEQLHSFRTNINQLYMDGVKERASLKQEIIHLRDLNQQVTKEANSLSKALKGDKKIQGNWGELILERVLEQSGLQNGREFSTQKGLRDQNNNLFKPDAILHLPGSREVIIDSKVSLVSWEKYVNSQDKQERVALLKQHIAAIRQHINGLAAKNYPSLQGLNSLDFVLMFMPIEAAYTKAVEKDSTLLVESMKNNILLVTPTSLLATVRTVEYLWRQDKQEKSAQQIAERATLLYDKFRLFTEDMEKLGNQLTTCQHSYENAMNKLCTGQGNLVAQAELLTQLGIRGKKEIPRSLLERSELHSEEIIKN
jgi:DNA recombination protein RmuC